jgi:hypothetical protein
MAAEKARGECSFLGIADRLCTFLVTVGKKEKGEGRKGIIENSFLDPTCCGYVNLVYKICHIVFRILLTGGFFFSFAINK